MSDARRRSSVAVVDDHPAIREALDNVLNESDDLSLSWSASSADEAFRLIEKAVPKILIVDIVLDDADGLDLVRNLCARYPELLTVVFSMYDEMVYAERALRAGASGYVMKSEPTKHVLDALRCVLDGDVYVSARVAAHMFAKMNEVNASDEPKLEELTDREIAVFQMLGQGHDVDEIADRLSLSRKTIETYRRRAKQKLGLKSLSDLMQYAVQWTYGMA